VTTGEYPLLYVFFAVLFDGQIDLVAWILAVVVFSGVLAAWVSG
jgi:hypothetical protein